MAFILAVFATIALIDLKYIIRRHSVREAVAFFLLFIPALTLAILQAKGVQIPSLTISIWHGLKAIGLSY